MNRPKDLRQRKLDRIEEVRAMATNGDTRITLNGKSDYTFTTNGGPGSGRHKGDRSSEIKHISKHKQALIKAAHDYTTDRPTAVRGVKQYIEEAKEVEDNDTLRGTEKDRVADFHIYIQEGGSEYLAPNIKDKKA